MRVLIVTLDFDANTSHAEVFEAIQTKGEWWHYMKWTWLIQTSLTVQQLTDALTPSMQGKGRMLVTELKHPYQGLQVPDAWKWISDRVI